MRNVLAIALESYSVKPPAPVGTSTTAGESQQVQQTGMLCIAKDTCQGVMAHGAIYAGQQAAYHAQDIKPCLQCWVHTATFCMEQDVY